MNDTLENWRKQIDALDEELLQILSKRIDIVRKVGIYKKKNQIPPLDEARWQEVLNSKLALGELLKLPKMLVEKIYTIIHEEALKIENGEI